MQANSKPMEATGASMMEEGVKAEVLQALVDKVVENGSAIRELNELLRKQAQPDPAAAELHQRFSELESHIGVIGKDITTLTMQVGHPANPLLSGMHSLQNSLAQCRDFFSQPLKKEVHYKHMIGWPLWILFGLLIIAGLELAGLTSANNKADLYQQNDLLWRAARLSEDSLVTHALDKTVRDYQANPDQFRKDVAAEEERRAELAEQWQQEQANMEHIRQLEKAKKR